MNDQTYLLILRLLHIGFGIFWAGSAIHFAVFMIPALKTCGPEGVKFMQAMGRTGYPIAVMISAIITVTAGILLIAKLSNGFQPEWFASWYSRILTMGGGMAIIAFLVGFAVNRPAAAKIDRISMAIAKQGGPPTADQMAQLMKLREKLFTGTKIISALLIIAIVGMSIFRYV